VERSIFLRRSSEKTQVSRELGPTNIPLFLSKKDLYLLMAVVLLSKDLLALLRLQRKEGFPKGKGSSEISSPSG